MPWRTAGGRCRRSPPGLVLRRCRCRGLAPASRIFEPARSLQSLAARMILGRPREEACPRPRSVHLEGCPRLVQRALMTRCYRADHRSFAPKNAISGPRGAAPVIGRELGVERRRAGCARTCRLIVGPPGNASPSWCTCLRCQPEQPTRPLASGCAFSHATRGRNVVEHLLIGQAIGTGENLGRFRHGL